MMQQVGIDEWDRNTNSCVHLCTTRGLVYFILEECVCMAVNSIWSSLPEFKHLDNACRCMLCFVGLICAGPGVWLDDHCFSSLCGNLSGMTGHFDKQTMKSDAVGQSNFQASTVVVSGRWFVVQRKAEKNNVASILGGKGSHQNGLK